jgi:Zn-dependent peptidase ImmA (M78 family)
MRFAIAHEFGHAVMGHGPIAFSRYGIGKRAHWQEVSANRFAAELLMPKPELVKYGYLAPGRIAEICEVSIHAATIRAEELGWRQRELQYMKWE